MHIIGKLTNLYIVFFDGGVHFFDTVFVNIAVVLVGKGDVISAGGKNTFFSCVGCTFVETLQNFYPFIVSGNLLTDVK